MDNSAQARFRRRILVLVALLTLFAGVVLVRYGLLALEGPENKGLSAEVPIERGRILDRNGRLLAFDIPKFNLAIRKNEIDPYRISKDLSTVAKSIGVQSESLEKKIRESSQNFIYLAKRLDIDMAKPIQSR